MSLIEAIGLDAQRVARLLVDLRERGHTVATAESLTGGLVCAVLTAVAGSSAVVRGGLVVYATELKVDLAGVDPALLAEHGAVHPEVAIQLARGARRRCGADLGVGLTGVAGPQPQDGVAPGTVHLALAGQGNDRVRSIELAGDRHAVRIGAVCAAIELLEDALR